MESPFLHEDVCCLMTPLRFLPLYLRCSIVVSLVKDVSNSVMFSAVLNHLYGPEFVTPL